MNHKSKQARISNPFSVGSRRFKNAQIEFAWFKSQAEQDIPDLAASIPDFAALEAYAGFYVIARDRDAVEARFGNRPTGRQNSSGAYQSESGASLVYSLAPTGHVATMLFPASSEFVRVPEDVVFVRIGRIGGIALHRRLRKDLKLLVAYQRVTSIDTSPSIREKALVWWMRFYFRTQVRGVTASPRANDIPKNLISVSIWKFVAAVLGEFVRPIAVLRV